MGKFVVLLSIIMLKIASGFLKFDKLEYQANGKYIKLNVSLDNSEPEKTFMNYFSEVVSEAPLKRMRMLVVIKNSAETPKSEKVFRCGVQLTKTPIDMCRIGDIQSTTFAKVFMQNFARSSNFDMKCPLKPGFYNLDHFTITDAFLLRYPRETKICLDLTLIVSMKDKGKMDTMWHMKIWLRFRKDLF